LAGGRVGLAVDTAARISALAEARTAHGPGRPTRPVVGRPGPGGSRAGGGGAAAAAAGGTGGDLRRSSGAGRLGAFGVALSATASPRRAANLALAAVPKAARLGREGFACG
ncbi:MAG TPA: hypothetical protein VE673_17370, partial [Pseudonocardiaceae bacterium]|nr:hypothetical protein [Pseudonocardiaceae bacterium]